MAMATTRCAWCCHTTLRWCDTERNRFSKLAHLLWGCDRGLRPFGYLSFAEHRQCFMATLRRGSKTKIKLPTARIIKRIVSVAHGA